MPTVRRELRGPVLHLTLDRPEVRNAFNPALIAELTQACAGIAPEVRAVVLAGAGPAFCAGADLDWMRASKGLSEAENARDAAAMAAMFRALDECPCPVIARVQGAALGGGAGLLACCDVVVAAEDATFGFTEVRLGILPAVISTFVLPAIGTRGARRFFLTGERFGAGAARDLGLVHEVAPAAGLDARVDELVRAVLASGPQAVAVAKRLIRAVPTLARDAAIEHTVETIARVRVTAEAQEGLGAFLEKRKPGWAAT
ncbi:MAG: enoyl-CoA hydratase/isomerase family protein [Planctomycetes bacterium]|nr:enoyl-CoA hydratase/isomerase family protein [Planctomycetota bacterium]